MDVVFIVFLLIVLVLRVIFTYDKPTPVERGLLPATRLSETFLSHHGE